MAKVTKKITKRIALPINRETGKPVDDICGVLGRSFIYRDHTDAKNLRKIHRKDLGLAVVEAKLTIEYEF